MQFTFRRFVRTSCSEAYYIFNGEGREGNVGTLNIHIVNKTIYGNLITIKELNDDDYEELLNAIYNDIVDIPEREDFVFYTYKGTEVAMYSDDVDYDYMPVVKTDLDKLYEKINTLSTIINSTNKSLIITEGKTDWKHIKSALAKFKENNKNYNLNINFLEYEQSMGDNELLTMCKQYSKTMQPNKVIFIFDGDNDKIIKQVNGNESYYKNWGNNVYSFSIPIPKHRHNTPNISIELYYKDEDLKITDENGRRLFLSNEFNNLTGRHINNNLNIICTDKNKYSSNELKIIDDFVFDVNNNKIVLSKNEYANNIIQNKYDNLDISEFKKIFDLIKKIDKL